MVLADFFAQVPLEDVLTGDAVGNLAGNLQG